MSGIDAPHFEACVTPIATACSAVLEWQQGGMTADDVAEVVLDATGGDREEAERLSRQAVEWWSRYVATAQRDRAERAAKLEANRQRA